MGLAQAPQAAPAAPAVVKVGVPPFGAPLGYWPTATTTNYRTLDPKGTMVQGAMIDVMNAIAKDAGIQVQYVASATGDEVGDLNSHAIDMVTNGSIGAPSAIAALLDFGMPIYKN